VSSPTSKSISFSRSATTLMGSKIALSPKVMLGPSLRYSAEVILKFSSTRIISLCLYYYSIFKAVSSSFSCFSIMSRALESAELLERVLPPLLILLIMDPLDYDFKFIDFSFSTYRSKFLVTDLKLSTLSSNSLD